MCSIYYFVTVCSFIIKISEKNICCHGNVTNRSLWPLWLGEVGCYSISFISDPGSIRSQYKVLLCHTQSQFTLTLLSNTISESYFSRYQITQKFKALWMARQHLVFQIGETVTHSKKKGISWQGFEFVYCNYIWNKEEVYLLLANRIWNHTDLALR